MSLNDGQNPCNRFRFLAESVLWHYRSQGAWVRWRVRNQLLGCDFYRQLLSVVRLPSGGGILHVGCGRGVWLSLLARSIALGWGGGAGRRGGQVRLVGMEIEPSLAASARLALGEEAEILDGDACLLAVPNCDMVFLLDLLLGLGPDKQEALLQKIAANLAVGGSLIICEPDASSLLVKVLARSPGNPLGLFYGDRKRRVYPRAAADWQRLLQSLGFQSDALPVTPAKGFPQTVLLARRNES